MIDPRLAWFAMGASFSAVLFGWPWHPRFSRYRRRGHRSNGNCQPMPPAPPYSSAAIAWRDAQAQRDANNTARAKRAAELYARFIDPSMGEPWEEGHTQRGNGNGGPTTPKPPIKPQPSGGRMIDQSGMTIGYQPSPRSGRTVPPPQKTMSTPTTSTPTPRPPMTEGIISVTRLLADPSIGAARITYPPTSWRLARRNGELILQAGSIWQQGRESGIEWNDVPTVDLGELDGTPAPAPVPESPAARLAVRPLLELVMGIGITTTLGKIQTIQDRIRGWLDANPPGQPVAIEPRGCPLPGACSCVEAPVPTTPAPVPVAERLPRPQDLDSQGTCWCFHGTAFTWGLFQFDPTAHTHWLPHWALPTPPTELEAQP